MAKSFLTALVDLKQALPNMSWHLEGDQLVIRVWLEQSDANLLRAGQQMFSPRGVV